MSLKSIAAVDYTVIIARDLPAMRHFYGAVLGLHFVRQLGDAWFEYKVGPNILALAQPRRTAGDPPTPKGAAALQLAFKVAYAEVDVCARELEASGATILEEPRDQPFGHRTLFFRDPDGNLLEVFADVPS
jgi:catechol 2,3-dioxygenase-like lactoylglutathione lyase family enzyme